MAENTVLTYELFKGVTIAASGSLTSPPIDLRGIHPSGFFSLHVIDLTDDGTGKFTYEVSNDDNADGAGVFVTPTTADDIVLAHTKASGPGGDGNDLYSFTPETARYIRIKCEETGTSDPVVVTATLAIQ